MKRVLAICLFAASTALIGCSKPQATSVMESSDQSAIAAYEAAVAADDAAANANPPDASETDAATPAPAAE